MWQVYTQVYHTNLDWKLLKKLLVRENKFISADNKVKIAEFVLKNNYFQFNCKVKQQISGIAIGTKFAPDYACVFMDQLETDFLRAKANVQLVWFRYTDDVFLYGLMKKMSLKALCKNLTNFIPI